MQLDFSFIIPVFNRPQEIKELLESFLALKTDLIYEIVIVEDGSTITSQAVVNDFFEELNINYIFKPNTGPGDSRNFGMRKAKGNYFIILDSDCILPPHYLTEVSSFLKQNFVDFFGGPDNAHQSFSTLQKAINFTMTSFLTTGGIRGHKKSLNKFQPRSFNMGISKEAFKVSGGFGNIHPGEDPDLTFRLWNLGLQSSLISNAYVYHKRRISWRKFHQQVYKFGSVRPILNHWHPKTKKLTYWFPSLFFCGLIFALMLVFVKTYVPIICYILYFILLFFSALIKTKSLQVALYAIIATFIQFYGYGIGFLKAVIKLKLSKKPVDSIFPHLFFKLS